MAYPYEYNYVHPPVKRWLASNGYEWKSEVCLNGRASKRADFIATRGDEKLVVECKSSSVMIRKSIQQVLEYKTLFETTAAALALPDFEVRSSVPWLCEQYGILLIPVTPMTDMDFVRLDNPNYDAEVAEFFKRIGR